MSEKTKTQWHLFPEILPPREGHYWVEGLFGISDKKKLMRVLSWYSRRKRQFAVSIGQPQWFIDRWAEFRRKR